MIRKGRSSGPFFYFRVSVYRDGSISRKIIVRVTVFVTLSPYFFNYSEIFEEKPFIFPIRNIRKMQGMNSKSKKTIGPYLLDRRLNVNEEFQAWIAVERTSNRKVFLKILPSGAGEENKSAVETIKDSLRHQVRIKSSKLLLANNYRKIEGNHIVEYPCLSTPEWQTLDHGLLNKRISELLPELCLILDFIHTRNLVHGDIKLSNFLIAPEHDSNRNLKLTDLDFLSQSGKPPAGMIFGTPDHIPPEIIENRIIDNRSDNFSLGKALLKAVADNPAVDPEYLEKLKSFAAKLTDTEISERPENLGNALLNAGLINETELKNYNRRLLAMQLIASFHEHKRALSKRTMSLKEFFVDINNVWNVPHELLSDLGEISKGAAIGHIKGLFAEASIERIGEYWRIDLSRDQLREFYSSFDYADKLKPLPYPETGEECREYMQRLSSYVKAIEDDNLLLKHYLHLISSSKDASIDNTDHDSSLFDPGRKFVLAGLCEALTDGMGALDHYREIYETTEKSNCFREDALYKLAFRKLIVRKLNEAFEYIEIYCKEAASTEEGRFNSRRLRTFVLLEQGKHDEAQRSFEELHESLNESSPATNRYKVLSDLAAVSNRRGDRKKSIRLYLKAIRLAENNNLHKEYIQAASNLGVIYCSLSEYDNSIKYLKNAINKMKSSGGTAYLPFIYAHLINAMLKKGDFHKSRYWLNQFRLSGSVSSSQVSFATYYLFEGHLYQVQGKLKDAEVALKQAGIILTAQNDMHNLIPVYHNLALVEFYRNNFSNCEKYCRKARLLAESKNLKADIAEIEVVSLLNDFYKTGKLDYNESSRVLKSLAEGHQPYYLALFFLHAVLNDIEIDPNDIPGIRPNIMQMLNDNKTPIFIAISQFITLKRDKFILNETTIPRLKIALKQMEISGHLYLNAIICYKLGRLYERGGYDKLARKFWKHGLEITSRIDNETLRNKIESGMRIPLTHSSDRSGTIQTVFRISEIFKNIDDYEESVSNLVEFAVKETGAERGVLLLYPQGHNAKIEAYYNIDNDSLKDVLDFSLSIPKQSIENLQPLIIDDATNNKFTVSYKSIFRHNIRSVLSIPLQVTDDLKGALYLDHHSIPALFDEGDISFAHSMANFISVLLKSLRTYRKIRIERNTYSEEFRASGVRNEFITEDPRALDMIRMIPRIATSSANVLILGESGTGKEIISELIHNSSGRKDGPLIKLNCAAVSTSMIESELFGVDPKTATDVSEKEGKLSAADGGTLFIDEIGDMPQEMQAKILRAIEYNEFHKVGSNKLTMVDVRFVYATNKNLEKLVQQGKFREDLFYRINTITIKVPPLRKRKNDVPILLKHFTSIFSQKYEAAPIYTPEAIEALKIYHWPGNVRELKNLAEKYAILYPGKRVSVDDLPEEVKSYISMNGKDSPSGDNLKDQITELLIAHNWNQSKVSRIMGIPLSTLRRKINIFDIKKS